MAYFDHDFIAFFSELSKNNNKEWFDANRKRYEKSVKEPFVVFVQEMINRIRADDPEVDIVPKDAIFRINRDIRFSADKTPYKTEVSALISAGGKKDKGYPGFFFQLKADEIRIYGGAHMLDKDQLYKIRKRIAANVEAFRKLLSTSEFKTKFETLHGDQNKRLPAEFQNVLQKEPLIANKSFYYFSKLKPELILKDTLPDIFMEYYFAGKPVNKFFQSALNT